MTLNTGRQIDPIFLDSFNFSDFNPADVFVDDGRTPPPQPLATEGTGAPPNPGGTISRPVNPSHAPEQPTIDPDSLPVPNGDIGLWSGEDGADNPFWTTPHTLFMPSDPNANPGSLPNGGPDGIGMTKEEFGRHGLQLWENLPQNQPQEPPGALDALIEFGDKLVELWDYLTSYTDPEHSTPSVANPHEMFASLLGKGATALPDGLGFDKELIGRMLGGYGEGDSSNAGKFADLLKALDAFDGATPGATGALLSQFGLEEFAGVVREFLPHLDLDQANLEHFAKTAAYTYQEQIDFSHLLAGSSVRDDLQI
jgi:hypothetical protein